MLEPKVRPLTTSQTEFLRRWDAEEDDELRRSLQEPWPSPMTTVYARKFPCTRCGGEAYEFVRESSASGLWLLNCFCLKTDCPFTPLNSFPLTPWTSWKIGRGYFTQLGRNTHTCPNQFDIIVPCNMGDEVVWQRGCATFRTIVQGLVANSRAVRRLAWLQMLRSIS
jgi:hypothetical protein